MTDCDICGETFTGDFAFTELIEHCSSHPDPEQTAGPDDPELWAEALALFPGDEQAQMFHYALVLLGEPDPDPDEGD